MKLIYLPDIPGLGDFGIQIPVHDTRATRCIEELEKDEQTRAAFHRGLITEAGDVLSEEDLKRAHSGAFVDRLLRSDTAGLLREAFELIDERGEYRRYDPSKAKRPLEELFGVILTRTAGTLRCMREALADGFCFYFGGGFHHAQYDFAHGFCLINDAVIGLRKLQAEGKIRSAWVIDGDAHKGDGTAAITRQDPTIRSLSIHMARGWPLSEEPLTEGGSLHPSFIPSDIDIPIEAGAENEYTVRLKEGLLRLAEYPRPDIAVVLFGADPYEHDELESARALRLSLKQIKERDDAIFGFLRERRIPAAYLTAGGYGPRAWEVNYRFLAELLTKDTV